MVPAGNSPAAVMVMGTGGDSGVRSINPSGVYSWYTCSIWAQADEKRGVWRGKMGVGIYKSCSTIVSGTEETASKKKGKHHRVCGGGVLVVVGGGCALMVMFTGSDSGMRSINPSGEYSWYTCSI
jgi:hypothetical protein